MILFNRFLAHILREKQVDTSTSTTDEFAQITESDETACCSTAEAAESSSPFSSSRTTAAAKISFIPLDTSYSSKQPLLSL
ncbi:unnamed protein product [Rotaria sp. Silwood2]|nr:unnamed protein product [Rotaria sp. Silwood2]CAF4176679.1 unnamed protein product [Rotaria sp. Silwood2]CAF4646697.1 unnamed protein product [Rotaria sp. Silwood2]